VTQKRRSSRTRRAAARSCSTRSGPSRRRPAVPAAP